MFASTVQWKQYDPFRRQKDDAFRSSKNGVLELAERFREFSGTLTKGLQTGDAEQQKLLFVRHQSPIRANFIFRRRWRTYVFGEMLRTFPSLCRERQVRCKRNIYGAMRAKISWWYIPPTICVGKGCQLTS